MIPRSSSVPHQKATKPSPCHKIHSMPLSFLPCKSPCPKTPPHARPTVLAVNRSWPMPHAACDASARCACPFPVYTKICIMLCPDASVGGWRALSALYQAAPQHVMVHKRPPRANITSGWGRALLPRSSKHLAPPTPPQASPPEVACRWPGPASLVMVPRGCRPHVRPSARPRHEAALEKAP